MAENKKRLAVVHDWPVDYEQEYTWRDGLCAAIKELINRDHEIKFWVEGEKGKINHPYFPICVSNDIAKEVKEFNPDVILCWGDLTRPNAPKLHKLGIPMALCFAGGDTLQVNLPYFEHIFVESQVYFDRFTVQGKSVSVAFGTNTELFKPISQTKIFDVIFPATYCEWKRHKLFAQATEGLKTVTAGYKYYTHEQYCYELFNKSANLTLPHVSAETLNQLYTASKVCLITSTAQGGSQRTVLEAIACNIPVITMSDSDKTSEYLRDSGLGKIVEPDPEAIREAINYYLANPVIDSRNYILKKWSHLTYADNLEKGLCLISQSK